MGLYRTGRENASGLLLLQKQKKIVSRLRGHPDHPLPLRLDLGKIVLPDIFVQPGGHGGVLGQIPPDGVHHRRLADDRTLPGRAGLHQLIEGSAAGAPGETEIPHRLVVALDRIILCRFANHSRDTGKFRVPDGVADRQQLLALAGLQPVDAILQLPVPEGVAPGRPDRNGILSEILRMVSCGKEGGSMKLLLRFL